MAKQYNKDVAIKKQQVMKSKCNMPVGYVSLSNLLGSFPKYADNAAAKEAGLRNCDLYINSLNQLAVVRDATLSPRLLDKIGATPIAAYSTRLLRNAYTGPLIRVRKVPSGLFPIGGEEKDIFPDLNGNLNEEVLLDFLGTSEGKVTKWYNQATTGSTHDLAQAAAFSQPQLAIGGAINKTNGKPTINLGSQSNLLTSGTLGFVGQGSAVGAYHAFTVAKAFSNGATVGSTLVSGPIARSITAGAGATVIAEFARMQLAGAFDGTTYIALNDTLGATSFHQTGIAPVNMSFRRSNFLNNSGGQSYLEARDNGVASLTVTLNNVSGEVGAIGNAHQADGVLQIGGRGVPNVAYTNSVLLTKEIQEYIHFGDSNTSIDAAAATIKNDINNYYSIF